MLCGTIAEATHFMILKSYIYIPKDHFKILLQMKFFDHLLPNQPCLKNVPTFPINATFVHRECHPCPTHIRQETCAGWLDVTMLQSLLIHPSNVRANMKNLLTGEDFSMSSGFTYTQASKLVMYTLVRNSLGVTPMSLLVILRWICRWHHVSNSIYTSKRSLDPI